MEGLAGLRKLSITTGNHVSPSVLSTLPRRVCEVVSKSPQLSSLHLLGKVDWSDAWRFLQKQELHLEEISATAVDGLLQYLASYSGLRRLSLQRVGAGTKAECNQLSAMFFDLLAGHATSLRHFSCTANRHGDWCFGAHNREAVSRLQHLITLEMSVDASDIDYRREATLTSDVSAVVSRVILTPRMP
jgi:hypothetical protein